MSFTLEGLGPADQGFITQLTPVILATLRSASSAVQRGSAGGKSQRWFGDSSQPWMTQLASDLNQMASILNMEKISIGFRPLAHRDGSFAVAAPPKAGWGKYTAISKARGQNFSIQLDTAWNSAPLYSSGPSPADSMFQTIVHELTHLIVGSDDHSYGVANCMALARTNPSKAKQNADNWGYFVEEFRS